STWCASFALRRLDVAAQLTSGLTMHGHKFGMTPQLLKTFFGTLLPVGRCRDSAFSFSSQMWLSLVLKTDLIWDYCSTLNDTLNFHGNSLLFSSPRPRVYSC
ncbi:unnamed protein product, partial [Scytosiphon promiscuus]